MNQKWFAFEFAAGAMTPAERAQIKLRVKYDRALAADVDCVEAALAPLALSPENAEVRDGLWDRIEADINEQASQHPLIITEIFEEGAWQPWAQGIEFKPLWDKQSYLVRCAPGSIIAAHRHDLDEHMLVVGGSIRVSGRILTAGDSQLSPAGTSHAEILSASGCMLLIQRVDKTA